ncbi:hypothetical protein U6A24_17330 [Aquimarina gracilis]|uniref:Lipocalin-like protein n=1 Tax=Aquimarina gracilis TaxID=874422 RepID=A0ABU5ZZE7_9FLAO|nr:hypothetical protein [Aquimarina gracilis]MEB3347241.1 hypothetical protein [Aquimarina gracilis]
MIKKIISLFCVVFMVTSCSNDDDVNTNCDQLVEVSGEQFKNAPNDQHFINSVAINGDCLNISFSSGGCDGDSWEIKLIDSEVVLFSSPPQRNLRLSLKNEELCDAVITKEITFDIQALQVSGNQILLNIENFEDQISYEY